MSDWQPIETAPEGELILVYEQCSRKIYMVTSWPWRGNQDEMVWMPWLTDESGGYVVDATHWMPLPEPPGTSGPLPPSETVRREK